MRTITTLAISAALIAGGFASLNMIGHAQPPPAVPARTFPTAPPPSVWMSAYYGIADGGGCRITLSARSEIGPTITFSGRVQTVGKHGTYTGWYNFDFIATHRTAFTQIVSPYRCGAASRDGITAVIIREISACKMDGKYYGDCEKLLATDDSSYRSPDPKVWPVVPVTVDLR